MFTDRVSETKTCSYNLKFQRSSTSIVKLRLLLAFSQSFNCIFWPIKTLNWLVAASKLHKLRETCYTVEWPYCPFALLCDKSIKLTQTSEPTSSRHSIVQYLICGQDSHEQRSYFPYFPTYFPSNITMKESYLKQILCSKHHNSFSMASQWGAPCLYMFGNNKISLF